MRIPSFLPILTVAAAGCSSLPGLDPSGDAAPAPVEHAQASDAPAHVVVLAVLISFEGAATDVRGVTRTKDEAKRLAELVLAQARAGREFADLVRLYSDDRANDGKCALANWGVPTGDDEVERQKTARGFAALAFSLRVDEVGLVEYDVNASPRGWQVLKRMR